MSGCGADAKRATPRPPTLPRALATQLAARSDAVANALAEGESCRARALAEQLRRDAIAAVNGRRIDTRLQEELTGAVNDLAARVRCVPPVVQPPAGDQHDEDHERGKHEGKGHGKKGKGRD
ncbi:MAG: hypothetical protein ACJ74D_01040 [Gaiellaceae bacterium]